MAINKIYLKHNLMKHYNHVSSIQEQNLRLNQSLYKLENRLKRKTILIVVLITFNVIQLGLSLL